ncbi:MAG: hypothetical protein AAFW95_07995 [Cyanobacteria bacterium J06638_6]
MATENNSTPSHYDPHLVPAETAARAQREGKMFGHVEHDSPNPEQIHTRDGYTVDQEGLINNYAVEPPMYINSPGDLNEVEKADAEQQARDRKAMTESHDWHHKGPGVL